MIIFSGKNENGQLLIESIVAISLATVGILGILFLLNRSFSVNREARERLVAANLAAEGVEVVKNIIDTNVARGSSWNSGFKTGDFELVYDSVQLEPANSRFLKISGDGFYNYASGLETDFQRTVKIKLSPNGNQIKVNSVVLLRDKSFKVDLEDNFYNWRD